MVVISAPLRSCHVSHHNIYVHVYVCVWGSAADRQPTAETARSRTIDTSQRALGRGGGSRPTGVLVQRWVQQRGVRGAAPGDFFTILMDFEAKSTYHTTYRTSLESSRSDLRRSIAAICERGATPSAASRQSIVGLW